MTSELPWNNAVLRGNMAEIYFKKGDYQTAKTIVVGLKETKKHVFLEHRILDSIAKQERQNQPVSVMVTEENREEINGLEAYRTKIKDFLDNDPVNPALVQITEEALETFPAQPYFYYANGYALNRTNKHREAVDILETGLDYLIDDIPLANSLYQELVEAYTALNNPVKAAMYKEKIKPGFK